MSLVDLSASPLSILPAVLALGLAIVTRHVLLSLSVGIISGAILLNDYSIANTLAYLGESTKSLFIEDDGLNMWNISIVVFLIFLGMITAVMTLSGGTAAFAV